MDFTEEQLKAIGFNIALHEHWVGKRLPHTNYTPEPGDIWLPTPKEVIVLGATPGTLKFYPYRDEP